MTAFKMNQDQTIAIAFGHEKLEGILHIPEGAQGIVLFAHGSGSSRLSTRNQFVAKILNQAKLATLLFDLLTPEEEALDFQTAELRFDIEFLASRLQLATQWLHQQPAMNNLPLGCFGASTGGGAALVAASNTPAIKAVVSRGGRPDLAGEALSRVQVPTLLIVGGEDTVVIGMNQEAFTKMHCTKELKIVPGATHLFEEPGTLDKVAKLAAAWFVKYLTT